MTDGDVLADALPAAAEASDLAADFDALARKVRRLCGADALRIVPALMDLQLQAEMAALRCDGTMRVAGGAKE